jgi:hypothetical protein
MPAGEDQPAHRKDHFVIMSKHRFRFGPTELILALAVLFFLGGLLALSFPRFYTAESRAQILLISSLALIFCFVSLASIHLIRRQKRAREWRQVLAGWMEEKEQGIISDYDIAAHLSQGALEHLAIRIYSRMGYHMIDHYDSWGIGCNIKLINPEGQLELLYCKQEQNPLALQEVSNFHAAVIREEAVRGFIWAPGGFSSAAHYWTKRKPIVLADSKEIFRLVESTLPQA